MKGLAQKNRGREREREEEWMALPVHRGADTLGRVEEEEEEKEREGRLESLARAVEPTKYTAGMPGQVAF